MEKLCAGSHTQSMSSTAHRLVGALEITGCDGVMETEEGHALGWEGDRRVPSAGTLPRSSIPDPDSKLASPGGEGTKCRPLTQLWPGQLCKAKEEGASRPLSLSPALYPSCRPWSLPTLPPSPLPAQASFCLPDYRSMYRWGRRSGGWWTVEGLEPAGSPNAGSHLLGTLKSCIQAPWLWQQHPLTHPSSILSLGLLGLTSRYLLPPNTSSGSPGWARLSTSSTRTLTVLFTATIHPARNLEIILTHPSFSPSAPDQTSRGGDASSQVHPP